MIHHSPVLWPELPNGIRTTLSDVLKILSETEYLDRKILDEMQARQLNTIAAYAENHSPHFRNRLKEAGLKGSELNSIELLRSLPLLSRKMLQKDILAIHVPNLPAEHGLTGEIKTSGSTGEAVTMKRTAVNQLFWLAYTMREHIWNDRDFSGSIAILRANLSRPGVIEQDNWGPPVSLLTRTGKGYAMPNTVDASVQMDWLVGINPTYLLVYPSNLSVLLDILEKNNVTLSALKQIRSIGETVTDALRMRVERQLGVTIADVYSSQELGMIAMQCPKTNLYYVQESLIVEILDENDKACKEGEVGRVVVTDLHNYATPLFRYDIGDYAEVGPPCPLGRGLHTLKRIAGRRRHMVLINGERRWPIVGFYYYRDIAPITQYQLIQKTPDHIEVRFAVERPVTQDEENQLATLIRKSLQFDFILNFVYFDNEIPRSKSGKFEEFICECA